MTPRGDHKATPGRGLSSAPRLAFYAINLDRSKERWTSLERLFGSLPWPLHRVRAIDGRKEPEAALAVRGLSITLPPEGIGWNPFRAKIYTIVEEACFVSHVLAWREFLASDNDHAVILEDDAVPMTGMVDTLSALLSCGVPLEYVKLEGKTSPGGRTAIPVAGFGAATLVRSLRPSFGSAAYLISRQGAQKLLAHASNTPMPVDDFLANPGMHGCDVLHVAPWPIVQSEYDTALEHLHRPHRRNPYHLIAQGARRMRLRAQLVAQALSRSPGGIFKSYRAPWRPDDVRQQVDRMMTGAPS